MIFLRVVFFKLCYYFQISSLKSVNWHDLRMMGVCFRTLRLSLI
ncbi:hypothetical protein HPHPH30_0277 [Helicobacter pylori Hp H-30]|nr:hypothetical protein HPHPH30_0277 [Helicobacter pylori Hp H-30]